MSRKGYWARSLWRGFQSCQFLSEFAPAWRRHCQDNLLSVWCLEQENNPARLDSSSDQREDKLRVATIVQGWFWWKFHPVASWHPDPEPRPEISPGTGPTSCAVGMVYSTTGIDCMLEPLSHTKPVYMWMLIQLEAEPPISMIFQQPGGGIHALAVRRRLLVPHQYQAQQDQEERTNKNYGGNWEQGVGMRPHFASWNAGKRCLQFLGFWLVVFFGSNWDCFMARADWQDEPHAPHAPDATNSFFRHIGDTGAHCSPKNGLSCPWVPVGATNLEIFRIREKNIPVDIVEVRIAIRCSPVMRPVQFLWGERLCPRLPLGDQGVPQPSWVLFLSHLVTCTFPKMGLPSYIIHL